MTPSTRSTGGRPTGPSPSSSCRARRCGVRRRASSSRSSPISLHRSDCPEAGGTIFLSRRRQSEPSRRRTGVEVEIGIGKSGRRAYGFDDIAIVPSRRTRDPEDIDITWELDAFHFELPLMAAAMDGVTSPATSIRLGKLGGVGVLNLEGLWTRYDDPEPFFDEIATLP